MSVAFYRSNSDLSQLFAVIGLGLIGQAVAKQLSLRATLINTFRIDWSKPQTLVDSVDQVVSSLKFKNLDLIWCAGAAGFMSSEEQLQREFDFFRTSIESIAGQKKFNLSINFMSSAGGLYENSGRVTTIELTTPSRPYAQAKRAQESILESMDIPNRIYRISTAYGYGGRRMGLISVMLRSAIIRKPMVIYANQNTLRDYICTTDIARTVVEDVIHARDSGIRILASGRATSIDSLLNIIHRIVGRKAVHTFHPNHLNDLDITFSREVIYPPLKSTPLETGIRLMADQLLINDRLRLSSV